MSATYSAPLLSALALAAALCAAPAAQAAIFTFTGDTTGKPTFNRPLEDLSGLSVVGTAVRYDTFSFRVSVAGDYSFVTTGAFDTFTPLYRAPFNPLTPLANALAANDDLLSPPFTTSGFAATLAAGTTDTYVTTGFGNTDFGARSTTIGGPGNVAVVPEVQTWALFALGLATVGALRRQQHQRG